MLCNEYARAKNSAWRESIKALLAGKYDLISKNVEIELEFFIQTYLVRVI